MPAKKTTEPPEWRPRYPNMQAALTAAAAAVKSPEKDGRNAFHRYDYTTAEAMIGATKRPLADAGLTVRLGDVSPGEKSGENVGSTWLITVTFIVDWEGGASQSHVVSFPAIRDKGRPWDKAINAALTNVTNYWLRGLLNIPRGLGPTVDERDDTADAVSNRAAQAAHAPAPPPSGPVEELRDVLRTRLKAKRDDVGAVIALVTERPDGTPGFAGWSEVTKAADPKAAATEVINAVNDFLTTLSPEALIQRAHHRAKERAQ